MNYRMIVFLILSSVMSFCKLPKDTAASASVLRSSNYILGKWKLHITHFDDPNKSMNEANRSYLMNLNDKIFYDISHLGLLAMGTKLLLSIF